MQRARRQGPAIAMAGLAMVGITLGASRAGAQSCTDTALPFTCTGDVSGGPVTINFTLLAELDFTAYSSNFDPIQPLQPLGSSADVLLILLDGFGQPALDAFGALVAPNDNGGSDFASANGGTLFRPDLTFNAGNVWDAVLQARLSAGDYQLQVDDFLSSETGGEERFGDFFGVHLSAVSPE